MMLSAPPVPGPGVDLARGRATPGTPYSLMQAPANTPVCERAQRFGRDAGVLERLDGHLEQQALLRVDAVGLAAAMMPKNSASKPATSSRNEPHRVVRASAAPPR